jgi:hypothetical protein
VSEPDNEFAHLTLPELQVMLRDTLRHAVPSDAEFVQRLTQEIAARERRT